VQLNPYQELGISENATQEEIRAAYLSLVKKYHPDRYQDNPLRDLAGEKIKKINEAYEILVKKPIAGTVTAASARKEAGSTDRKGYNGPYQAAFLRAREFINQSNLTAARAILDAVSEHNAEWYFLSGIIHLRQGSFEKARDSIARAYELSPNNTEYRNAYLSLKTAGDPYKRMRAKGRSRRKSRLFGWWPFR